MAERKAAGATWDEVAAEFSVARSTARQAVAAHRAAGGGVASGDPLGIQPADALRAALRTYNWAETALQALAAEADNSSARVGAVRAAVLVAEKRIELLIAAGVIPSADEALLARMRQEKAIWARAFVDLLERYGVRFSDVATEVERILGSPPSGGQVDIERRPSESAT